MIERPLSLDDVRIECGRDRSGGDARTVPARAFLPRRR
jgi:hypothetical protein